VSYAETVYVYVAPEATEGSEKVVAVVEATYRPSRKTA
jgi:hypothetical protein